MQAAWVGKNVDLALLSVYVEDFLRTNGFRVRKDESPRKCIIFGTKKSPRGLSVDVTVNIVGDSNDFVVELLAGERMRSSIKLGFLTTVIGGGPFFLRALKSQEALEKLEKEFWPYIEETITRLTGSASSHT